MFSRSARYLRRPSETVIVFYHLFSVWTSNLHDSFPMIIIVKPCRTGYPAGINSIFSSHMAARISFGLDGILICFSASAHAFSWFPSYVYYSSITIISCSTSFLVVWFACLSRRRIKSFPLVLKISIRGSLFREPAFSFACLLMKYSHILYISKDFIEFLYG